VDGDKRTGIVGSSGDSGSNGGSNGNNNNSSYNICAVIVKTRLRFFLFFRKWCGSRAGGLEAAAVMAAAAVMVAAAVVVEAAIFIEENINTDDAINELWLSRQIFFQISGKRRKPER